jgi:hypothetical protein
VNVNASYFTGTWGGDHSLKIGYWKDAYSYNSTHTPGYAARVPDRRVDDCLALSIANEYADGVVPGADCP